MTTKFFQQKTRFESCGVWTDFEKQNNGNWSTKRMLVEVIRLFKSNYLGSAVIKTNLQKKQTKQACILLLWLTKNLPFTDKRIFISAHPKSLLALQTYTRESSRLGLLIVSTDTSEFSFTEDCVLPLPSPLPVVSLSSMPFVSSLTASRGTSLILKARQWTIGIWMRKTVTSTGALIPLVSTYSKGNVPFSSSSELDVTARWLSRKFNSISLRSVPFSRLHSIRIGRSPSGWHTNRTTWSFCAVCDCDATLKRGGSVVYKKVSVLLTSCFGSHSTYHWPLCAPVFQCLLRSHLLIGKQRDRPEPVWPPW